MFFAPPKVKSLSRYAEFGSYMGARDFLIMLTIATIMHAFIIGYYAMKPSEEVLKIPVRVLNIRLSGSKAGGAIEMPAPESMPVPNAPAETGNEMMVRPQPVVRPKPAPAPVPEQAPAKASVPKHVVYTDTHVKPARHIHSPGGEGTGDESSLSTPKQYVRTGNLAGQGGEGNGAGSGMSAGNGDDIVQRYEQMISLWISQHKIYPQAAKQQGIEGDAIVRIRIDRSGHIILYSIDRSSGNAVIDAAVISMVQSSDPVPRAPADYPDGTQLEFLIPVSFRLQ